MEVCLPWMKTPQRHLWDHKTSRWHPDGDSLDGTEPLGNFPGPQTLIGAPNVCGSLQLIQNLKKICVQKKKEIHLAAN